MVLLPYHIQRMHFVSWMQKGRIGVTSFQLMNSPSDKRERENVFHSSKINFMKLKSFKSEKVLQSSPKTTILIKDRIHCLLFCFLSSNA